MKGLTGEHQGKPGMWSNVECGWDWWWMLHATDGSWGMATLGQLVE